MSKVFKVSLFLFYFLSATFVQANVSPFITNISPFSPMTVSSGNNYRIIFYTYDYESASMWNYLYYNTSKSMSGAQPITNLYNLNGTNDFYWSTKNISHGKYYIAGVVADSSNAMRTNYSMAQLTITNTNKAAGSGNTRPVISNISPLSPVTVYSGNTYPVYYEAYDPESTSMNVLLYINTTKSMSGAQIITNSLAFNGTNLALWSTKDFSHGKYYIAGVITDSSNASRTNYSMALLTLTNTNHALLPPARPQWLSVYSAWTNRIDLYWQNLPNETSFTLFRNTIKNSNTAGRVTGRAMNVTNYSDIDLSKNTKYYYWLKAYNGAGSSPFSYTASNKTLGSGNTEPIITNISPFSPVTVYSGNNYSITFNVYDAEAPVVWTYLYYNTSKSLTGAQFITNLYMLTNGSHTFIWPTKDVGSGKYYFACYVIDSSNTMVTNYSRALVNVTNTNRPVSLPLTPPVISNLSPLTPVSIYSGQSYNITYYAFSYVYPDVIWVDLYYNTVKSLSGAVLIQSNHLSTNNWATGCSWSTLNRAPGAYFIIGVATDFSNARSTNYSTAQVTILRPSSTNGDVTPPKPPANLRLTPDSKKLTLTWNRSTEPDVANYYIYRKAPADADYKIIQITSADSYIDVNVANGTVYYYKVRAVDSSGNPSSFSDPVYGMPVKVNGKVVLSDNLIKPKDPQELYINIMPMDSKVIEVDIYIYKINMKLVKKIHLTGLNSVQNLYRWDLRNANNVRVPTGAYFIYVKGVNFEVRKRIYIVR
ncbi:MAG: hypothetical protein PHF84_04215 [bacterium]|nr:hypothetical protein [bacterium]